MDASLKQRLIGAAVLVALAVIFLPMLISGPEPDAGTSSVPVDVPNRDNRDFQTATDLGPPVQSPLQPPMAAWCGQRDAGDRVAWSTLVSRRVSMSPACGSDGRTGSRPPAAARCACSDASACTPRPPAAPPAASARGVVDRPLGRESGQLCQCHQRQHAGTQLRQRHLPTMRNRSRSWQGRSARTLKCSRATRSRIRTPDRTRCFDLPTGVVSLEGKRPAAVRPAVAEGLPCNWENSAVKPTPTLRDRARGAGLASYVSAPAPQRHTGGCGGAGTAPCRCRALKAGAEAKLGADGNIVPHP